MRNQSSIQVVCAEYERILTKSQAALTSWIKARAELSGRRKRDICNHIELRALQLDFLKVWGLLQDHKRDCKVCQITSIYETTRMTQLDVCLREPTKTKIPPVTPTISRATS